LTARRFEHPFSCCGFLFEHERFDVWRCDRNTFPLRFSDEPRGYVLLEYVGGRWSSNEPSLAELKARLDELFAREAEAKNKTRPSWYDSYATTVSPYTTSATTADWTIAPPRWIREPIIPAIGFRPGEIASLGDTIESVTVRGDWADEPAVVLPQIDIAMDVLENDVIEQMRIGLTQRMGIPLD
jgi:hypothetical protein